MIKFLVLFSIFGKFPVYNRHVKGLLVPENPCPHIFSYNINKYGVLYGYITVPKPENDEKVRLEIKFQIPNKVQEGNNGKIELLPETLNDNFMYYILHFPRWSNYPPKILSISVNNVSLCSGPQFDRNFVPSLTTITLWNARTRIVTKRPCSYDLCDNQPFIIDVRSTLIPKQIPNVEGINENFEKDTTKNSDPQKGTENDIYYSLDPITVSKLAKNPFFNSNFSKSLYDIKNQNESNNNSNKFTPSAFNLDPILNETNKTNNPEPREGKPYPYDDICGISSDVNHLIYNGKTVSNRLEFPWLAAIFKNDLGLNFICGGSLLSRKHVVTAAHCVKLNDKTVTHNELVILLGRKNLQSWSNDDGALYIEPEKIIIHPDYKKWTADADIALLVMSNEVSFTPYIKPVCLWTENNSLQIVVNSVGVVVGWGRNENGEIYTVQPKQVTMPIVTNEKCLRSNKAFADITSTRTFCAGYKNDSGPCNGDSGGGFVMKIKDRWVLRGVVSISLSKMDRVCNLQEYVVFTDASKFTKWILNYII